MPERKTPEFKEPDEKLMSEISMPKVYGTIDVEEIVMNFYYQCGFFDSLLTEDFMYM